MNNPTASKVKSNCVLGILHETSCGKKKFLFGFLLLLSTAPFPCGALTFLVKTTSGPISRAQGLGEGRLESRHWCTILLVFVFCVLPR